MKNPLGVSTLEEAASWLSEYSGQQRSAREVLDLGFKRALADFQRDGVEAAPTLWVALPPSTRFVFRRWTVERGCERRRADWQMLPIAYENSFALLCGGGSAAVEFPRASDPWSGEDGLCIDSPDTHILVSIDMLRVYARDLVCLAAELTASTDQPARADAGIEPEPEQAQHQVEPVAALQGTTGRQSQIDDQREENVSSSWQDRARAIADEMHRRDLAARVWSSNSDIADRVAKEAMRRGVTGPRGQLTAGNILREALQGGRWKRPTD